MPARRRRCKRWLMTDLINVSANDPLLMDAAVKRSGSRLQGGSRLPVRTLSLQWGNRFPFKTLFYFHIFSPLPSPPQGSAALCRQLEPCSRDNEGGKQIAGLFLIQRTLLSSSFLSTAPPAPLFQANNNSPLHRPKTSVFFLQNFADNDEMCFKCDRP